MQAHADVLEVILEIAVVGDRIGDHAGDGEVDGRELGELELLDQLLLQGLAVLVAEIAAAVVIARPGAVRGAARLLAPGLVRDLHLGLLALHRPAVRIAVELGVLLLEPAGGSSRSRAASGGASSASSSSASSMTLVSSVSRTWACKSREGSCSSRMACCSCGVMVSCWPMRSCRLGFNIVL